MKRTVLLAAYRLDVLQTVPITLQLAGIEVEVVESGLEALRRTRSLLPDLVIIDPALPDIDGATVADILRRLPSTASITTVLLDSASTAESSPFNRTQLLLQMANILSLCCHPRKMPAEIGDPDALLEPAL
ncbi:MAG TPA: response regulator [Verrucomicrobiae bacterium]|jgi:CheY-like chemotaxis protein|nr:response regulator [Verrucomicrobiae bacterium]